MKDKKRTGMIFQLTLLMVFILLSILSLMKTRIESTFNISKLYNQRLEDREKMDTLTSVVFYEFKTVDNYILMDKINSLEEYIFLNKEKEQIWKKSLENEKSLGGYYIKKSSHSFEEIFLTSYALVKFIFEKTIFIKDNKNKNYLEIKLVTNEISLSCEKKEKNIECFWEEDIIKNIKIEGDFIH